MCGEAAERRCDPRLRRLVAFSHFHQQIHSRFQIHCIRRDAAWRGWGRGQGARGSTDDQASRGPHAAPDRWPRPQAFPVNPARNPPISV